MTMIAGTVKSRWKLFGLLGVVVAGLLGYWVYSQTPMANTRTFYANKTYQIAELVCAHRDAAAALCSAVKFKTIPNLGVHNDLWVLLDALHVIRARSSDAQRQDTIGLYKALNDSLTPDGVLQMVANDLQAEPADGVYFNTSVLYYSVITQYSRCTALVAAAECRNYLPVAVGAALRSIAEFVSRVGESAAPFEMINRKASVEAIKSSGL